MKRKLVSIGVLGLVWVILLGLWLFLAQYGHAITWVLMFWTPLNVFVCITLMYKIWDLGLNDESRAIRVLFRLTFFFGGLTAFAVLIVVRKKRLSAPRAQTQPNQAVEMSAKS